MGPSYTCDSHFLFYYSTWPCLDSSFQQLTVALTAATSRALLLLSAPLRQTRLVRHGRRRRSRDARPRLPSAVSFHPRPTRRPAAPRPTSRRRVPLQGHGADVPGGPRRQLRPRDGAPLCQGVPSPRREPFSCSSSLPVCSSIRIVSTTRRLD